MPNEERILGNQFRDRRLKSLRRRFEIVRFRNEANDIEEANLADASAVGRRLSPVGGAGGVAAGPDADVAVGEALEERESVG